MCSIRKKGKISSLQTIFKREDDSICDFTRRFRGVVQQIDTYSMDAVLLNFQRSFGPTTPYFHSLSRDLPMTMEELYKREDKYSTVEDNIRATSQTMIIIAQSGKQATKGQPEKKGIQSKNYKRSRDQSERRREPPQFTPLNISYERLLTLFRDHLDFKWPTPILSDPAQPNHSLRHDYDRDHSHETNRCRSFKFMVEKLIRVGHLRRYIRETVRGIETTPAVERIAASARAPA